LLHFAALTVTHHVLNSTYEVAYSDLIRRDEYGTDVVHRACRAVFLNKLALAGGFIRARYFEQAFVCLGGFIQHGVFLERRLWCLDKLHILLTKDFPFILDPKARHLVS
jgi:hypothetical protein